MPRVTSAEATDLFLKCAESIEAVDDALDEAYAVIVSIIDTIDFESFSPDQRVAIQDWHLAVIAARKTLRLPSIND
jgi:hypothetical protein